MKDNTYMKKPRYSRKRVKKEIEDFFKGMTKPIRKEIMMPNNLGILYIPDVRGATINFMYALYKMRFPKHKEEIIKWLNEGYETIEM